MASSCMHFAYITVPQQRITRLPVARTADNVALADQGERYVGHTADVLFTRWLASTEAALAATLTSSNSTASPPATAAATPTPATLSRFFAVSGGTPSGGPDILALEGHPLSAQRAAVAVACGRGDTGSKAATGAGTALGTDWYAESPMPAVVTMMMMTACMRMTLMVHR